METSLTQRAPVAQPWHRPFWKPVHGKEGVFTYLILIHVLSLIGLILFPLPSLKVLGLTVLSTALGGLGTTVCYHRMLAHKTLRTHPIVEQFLIFWAVFNGSGRSEERREGKSVDLGGGRSLKKKKRVTTREVRVL